MKIGTNFWIWVSPFRTDRDLGLIDKAKSMGAGVVEFAIEDDGVVDAKLLRRALSDNQMECSVVGIFGPQRDFASEDPAVRSQGLEHARRCVDLTAEGGADVFTGAVVAAGCDQEVTESERSTRLGFAAEVLHEIGEHSAKAGVRFCVEILNRYESNLVTTAAEARELMDQVGHAAVGIHLDCFHMSIEETDLGEAIHAAGDKLYHLHASASHRGTPGEGHQPWAEVAQALRDIDYRGYGIIESFNPAGRLAHLARAWHPYAASQDELARRGLTFLKSVLPAA